VISKYPVFLRTNPRNKVLGVIIKVGKEVQKVSPTERKWVELTALVRSEMLAMTEENHGPVLLRILECWRSWASCKFKQSIS
jgi:hypothetical protein